jgi:hypothetical protein
VKLTIQQRNAEMVDRRRKGQTLDEIGQHFGLTRERVRQIIKEIDPTLVAREVGKIKRKVRAEKASLARNEIRRKIYGQWDLISHLTVAEIGIMQPGGGSNLALLANPGGAGSLPWWSLSPIPVLLLVAYFSIPQARKFDQAFPCAVEHPGFCNCDMDGDKVVALAALCKCLPEWSVGDLIPCRFYCGGGHPDVHYKFIASLSNPARIVLLRACLVDGKVTLSRDKGELFDFEMAQTALHSVWLACGSSPAKLAVVRYRGNGEQPVTFGDAVQPWCCNLPAARQTRQVWPVDEEGPGEHHRGMSATAEWMQKVMRNLVSSGKAGPTTAAEDDEDGTQAQEMRSIALNILAQNQKVKRARLRASKLVRKVRAGKRARTKAKSAKVPTVVVEAVGAASSSDAVLVEVAVSAPKAKAGPRNAAPPKANQVIIAGRMITRLKRGGLSLQCSCHVGEDCAKYIGYTVDVDEAEAVNILLAWEICGDAR